jgi:hypothetical protein
MAVVNDDNSVTLYGESIANFGAAYAATQESVKSQGATIVSMQGQMQAMQQYCMALGQQAPPGIYMLQQQQHGCRSALRQLSTGCRKNPALTAYQQPGGFPGSQHQLQPPTPFKTFENWNYCRKHGGVINNTHFGMSCRNPGPSHNPNATRTNTMGGNTAGLHKTILPSASGCVPPAPRWPQAPAPPMWQQPLPPVNFTPMMAEMRPMMPTPPYQAINYMGHQFGPPPPQFGPPPPAVAPPAPPPTPPA